MNEDKLQNLANANLELLKVKIELLLNQYFHKPYVLDFRVKSISKLKQKQLLFFQKKGYLLPLESLPDVVGFRISLENESDVIEVSELISKFLKPSRLIDYFNYPKDTGYKAFMYYFENLEVNMEIQIMTIEMMKWTNATHEEHDKRKYFS